MGLGFHGGGIGAVRFFVKQGAKVTVTDLKPKSVLKDAVRALAKYRPRYVLGQHRKEDFRNADFIFKSPDVPNSSPYLAYARKRDIPILDVGSMFLSSCPAPVIGVTGTKGKSTTATLLAKILAKHFGKEKKIWLLGVPGTSLLEDLSRIRKEDIAILELSSFQLEDILYNGKKSPHIAIITSLFPDHLNRHGSFREYARAKSAIFRFQKKNDFLLLPQGVRWLGVFQNIRIPGKLLKVNADSYKSLLKHAQDWTSAEQQNFALAFSAGELFGATKKDMAAALLGLKRLPGRCEIVRSLRGITFINNTTATNPEAAINAIQHFGKQKRIIVISGGSDKKLEFKDLARALARYSREIILLPGNATEKIKRLVLRTYRGNVWDVDSMQKAVVLAYALSESGDIVLLSPGATSFGLFKHEFDRGDQFVSAVKSLGG